MESRPFSILPKSTLPTLQRINVRKWFFRSAVLLLAFLVITLSHSLPVQSRHQDSGTIQPISIHPDGSWGDGASTRPSISADGRFIAFLSQAKNILPRRAAALPGLYLHDRMLKTTELIAGETADGGISADGRFLWVVSGKGTAAPFLFDRLTQSTRTISDPAFIETSTSLSIEGLSSDGRYAAVALSKERGSFTGSENSQPALYFYDRLNEQLIQVPTSGLNLDRYSHGLSGAISGDGRILAFRAAKPGQDSQADQPAIYAYHRVLGSLAALPPTPWRGDGKIEATRIALSNSGDIVAVQDILADQHAGRIAVFDRRKSSAQVIRVVEEETNGYALSAGGKFLAVIHPDNPQNTRLVRYPVSAGDSLLIDDGVLGDVAGISNDGSKIVYTKEVSGVFQVFLWEEANPSRAALTLAGRVTDSTGYPLALVRIEDDQGHKTSTDQGGYFWINGIEAGTVNLVPTKEGFEFTPKRISLEATSDTLDLRFISNHKDTLREAKKDLGMPYSKNRGANGLFHGYHAGYCTDLVLDAFTWGADFDIQFALEMDFKAHPWHVYRWRDARDAHDMWRYFYYSGQIQPHENPYLPGDIVFFDWTRDGEIDHVALVSQVTGRNRPDLLYDATGKIDINPGGLAAELEWQDFHEQTVRGFARWSGLFEPVLSGLPEGQILQFNLVGQGLDLRLLDESGAAISSSEMEIEGGRVEPLDWEQAISIMASFQAPSDYLFVLNNPSDQPRQYTFTGQFLENGLVSDRVEVTGEVPASRIAVIRIRLEQNANSELLLRAINQPRRVEGTIHYP